MTAVNDWLYSTTTRDLFYCKIWVLKVVKISVQDA